MSLLEVIKNTLMEEIPEFKTNSKYLECLIRPMKLGDKKENFSSTLYNADLINKSTNTTTSLIVKVMPANAFIRSYHGSDNQFHNEDLMYRQVIPAMIKNSNLKDESPVSSLFPKSYYKNHDSKLTMIVLEDLKIQGYTLAGSSQVLDYDHCKVALNGIARFHALSYVYKHKCPEDFLDVVNSIKESRFNDFYRRRSNVYLQYTSLETIKYIRRSDDPQIIQFRIAKKEFLERLQEVFETPVALLEKLVVPEESLGVLCHGDFYRNNMMFRYENNKPSDVKFLDFQTVRYANPSIDIVFFFHMNTTVDLRKHHLAELLVSYQNALLDSLVEMSNCSKDYWEQMLNLTTLRKDFERRVLYGYTISTMFLHLLLATSNELQEMGKLKEDEDDEVIPSNQYLKRAVLLGGNEARSRSVAIIKEMSEMDQEAVFWAFDDH